MKIRTLELHLGILQSFLMQLVFADPSALYPHLAQWWTTASPAEVRSLLLVAKSDAELDGLDLWKNQVAGKFRTERAILTGLMTVR
jgi:hypothetical protein